MAAGGADWEDLVRRMFPPGTTIPEPPANLDYSIALEYDGPPVSYELPRIDPAARATSTAALGPAVELPRGPHLPLLQGRRSRPRAPGARHGRRRGGTRRGGPSARERGGGGTGGSRAEVTEEGRNTSLVARRYASVFASVCWRRGFSHVGSLYCVQRKWRNASPFCIYLLDSV